MFPCIDTLSAATAYGRGQIYGQQAQSRIQHSVITYARLFAACGIDWASACERGMRFEPVIERVDADLMAELRGMARGYVEVIRNTPLIVQLFLIFFGLPGVGIKLDVMTASVLALTINLGAYTAEIVRAGIESVPKSQIEAGVSLGLTGPQIFRHVVLMPALKNVYPSLSSQFVLMMLATSVVSQISAADLFHAGSIIQSRTFRDFEVYTVISLLYLCLTLLMRGGFSLCFHLIFRRR